jgi:phytoene dehydrogenase-like protein
MKELFNKSISRRSFLRFIAATMAVTTIDWSKIEAMASTVEPKSDYPVVVIGAGLGGLIAATYLAKNDFPVTVIEQHDVPGGYITSFERGKFTFDVAPHYTLGIGPFLEYLGIQDKVEFVKPPDVFRAITPDYDLILPQEDPEGIIRILSEKFPHETQGIRNFMKQLNGLLQEWVKPFDMKTISSTHPIMWNLSKLNTTQVLDQHFKDPKLKAIFCVFLLRQRQPYLLAGNMLNPAARGSATP